MHFAEIYILFCGYGLIRLKAKPTLTEFGVIGTFSVSVR